MQHPGINVALQTAYCAHCMLQSATLAELLDVTGSAKYGILELLRVLTLKSGQAMRLSSIGSNSETFAPCRHTFGLGRVMLGALC